MDVTAAGARGAAAVAAAEHHAHHGADAALAAAQASPSDDGAPATSHDAAHRLTSACVTPSLAVAAAPPGTAPPTATLLDTWRADAPRAVSFAPDTPPPRV